jgi:hypothetical protein
MKFLDHIIRVLWVCHVKMVKSMDILEELGALFKHPEEKGGQFYRYAGNIHHFVTVIYGGCHMH